MTPGSARAADQRPRRPSPVGDASTTGTDRTGSRVAGRRSGNRESRSEKPARPRGRACHPRPPRRLGPRASLPGPTPQGESMRCRSHSFCPRRCSFKRYCSLRVRRRLTQRRLGGLVEIFARRRGPSAGGTRNGRRPATLAHRLRSWSDSNRAARCPADQIGPPPPGGKEPGLPDFHWGFSSFPGTDHEPPPRCPRNTAVSGSVVPSKSHVTGPC